ncbi:hypothetical protein BGW80DRAFT_1457464 [Lactifluus volemus]|nr:hypothetical protein BGW80DRAFT_1457464 [Lactifluus volemus]
MSHHRDDLLVDGYIAHSLSPIKAERYLYDLLKANPHHHNLRQLYQAIPRPDRSGGVTFVVGAVATRQPPEPLMQDHYGRPLWLLDYNIARTGTVVPQELWSPQNVNDFKQYVTDAELQLPIFFTQENGHLGLSLDDAAMVVAIPFVAHACRPPLGEKRPRSYASRCVVVVVDLIYSLIDRGPQPNHRLEIAHHIGRSVEAFIRAAVPDQNRDASAEPWMFGPRGMNPAKIRVIGAIHVSAGSWMPILQLNDWVI